MAGVHARMIDRPIQLDPKPPKSSFPQLAPNSSGKIRGSRTGNISIRSMGL
jgi:hypothetical protein